MPVLEANRLVRRCLTISNYDYSTKYRKISDHGNVDAISRLPAGPDPHFDGEVCEG